VEKGLYTFMGTSPRSLPVAVVAADVRWVEDAESATDRDDCRGSEVWATSTFRGRHGPAIPDVGRRDGVWRCRLHPSLVVGQRA